MKRFLSVFMICLLLTGVFSDIVYADEAVDISAKSAILIDSVSGEVIYEKDPHAKMYPASMTKIMTMLLVMENIKSGKITINDSVSITQQATSLGGTQLFLEEGEIRTVEELLYGVAVESANDAATALGIYIGGSLENFASMMNNRAKELGMNDTHFVNACGLHDDNHYTSAYDMALVSKELLKHEDILRYTSTWMIDVYIGKNNNKLRTLANTNKLISRFDHIDGLKTGYTEESGHCMSATGKTASTRLIAVVMDCTNASERFDDAKKLLDYGFGLYEGTYPIKNGDIIGEISVINGEKDKVNLIADGDVYAFGPKGSFADPERKIQLTEDVLYADVKEGMVLGEVLVYNGEKLLGKVPVVTEEAIAKCSLKEYLKRIVNIILY
ncbi:MAG: D-alanyl-D-alanine carboxypeptidase [Anaerofustis stercorihominis]|nr:D-alanyl-D-alanine carboxypeptidase [Anaerofustis stercorihominis]